MCPLEIHVECIGALGSSGRIGKLDFEYNLRAGPVLEIPESLFGFGPFLFFFFFCSFGWSFSVLGGALFVWVIARIYPRFLSVITGAKTGHGVGDWVLEAVTLACHSFFFVYYYSLSNQSPEYTSACCLFCNTVLSDRRSR
jgi:hypothetical protein